MPIISWNCKLRFCSKLRALAKFAPDLLVIPECERLSEEQLQDLGLAPSQFLWVGRLEKKGLGLFAVGEGIERRETGPTPKAWRYWRSVEGAARRHYGKPDVATCRAT